MIEFLKDIFRPAFHIYMRQYRAILEVYMSIKVSVLTLRVSEYPTMMDYDAVTKFVLSCQLEHGKPSFKYSSDSKNETLYSSVYACLLSEILPGLKAKIAVCDDQWIDFFNAHQDSVSGYFLDSNISSRDFPESDWWGARHLALHVANAYASLGAVPKYRFHFLKQFTSDAAIDSMMKELDSDILRSSSDVDNKIMNIFCLMQFERDVIGVADFDAALVRIKDELLLRVNPDTGLWGSIPCGPRELSRSAQVAYHLLPIFIHDKHFGFDAGKLITTLLSTQNKLGGYGVGLNSSACEDIDTSDLLIWLFPFASPTLKEKIDDSLSRHYGWLLSNQMGNGGFTFKRFQSFTYGDRNMHGSKNQGAMFPTWFRILSLVHLSAHQSRSEIGHHKSPGYYFLGKEDLK